MEEKKQGYVYILTNPSFMNDWVKIGKTSKSVEQRVKDLDGTAVPLPFQIYATLKTCKYAEVEKAVFGETPVQIGYCNGRNTTYNGFEYHKAPEINVAVTPFMLVLGHSYDIAENNTYRTLQAEVFFVPKGTAIEMFGTTLHLSPLRVCDEGFKGVVILPKGTNTPLDEKRLNADRESKLLLLKNKWVVAHPEREPLIKQGAFAGVIGENKELFY